MNYQLINPINPALTVTQQILVNRGVELSQIEHFLNVTDEDIVDPATIKNIAVAASLLVKHIQNGSKIFLVVDSDVDGYTSSAILLNYLHLLFPSANITYALQPSKQHGLIPEIMDTIPAETNLVIVPDAGSNDFAQHKILKEQGIDVLVIDHHETDELPQDACVVNNQICDYPTKSLSGAGMVYKFCCFLDQLLHIDKANDFVDLAALGIVSDVMYLKDFETKRIVEKGLTSIKNGFFAAMIKKQDFKIKGKPTPFNVSFYITPLMNAVIRMGSPEEKLILFEAMLDSKRDKLIPSTKRGAGAGALETRIDQACRNCSNIKNHQTDAVNKSLSKIEQKIEEDNLLANKILTIALKREEDTVDRSITGLIANQLMGKYQRPVLLLHEKGNNFDGSARNYDKGSFSNFRDFMKTSHLVNYAAGHANAFGVSIPKGEIKNFIEYSNKKLANQDFSPSYKVDFIFNSNDEIADKLLEMANLAETWWSHPVDEEPSVAIENVTVHAGNLHLMARNTMKITLPNGIDLIKFGTSNEEYENLYSDFGCVTLNIVGKPNRNEWNGKVSPQILIDSYEIVDRAAYYF